MSLEEAQEYADVVIEALHEYGVITESAYGKMTENQRVALAEKIQEKAKEN